MTRLHGGASATFKGGVAVVTVKTSGEPVQAPKNESGFERMAWVNPSVPMCFLSGMIAA
jgi:hypothetical protein